MFIVLLLIRYNLLFAVHVDLNSKIVIDSQACLPKKNVGSLFDFKSILPRFQ